MFRCRVLELREKALGLLCRVEAYALNPRGEGRSIRHRKDISWSVLSMMVLVGCPKV